MERQYYVQCTSPHFAVTVIPACDRKDAVGTFESLKKTTALRKQTGAPHMTAIKLYVKHRGQRVVVRSAA